MAQPSCGGPLVLGEVEQCEGNNNDDTQTIVDLTIKSNFEVKTRNLRSQLSSHKSQLFSAFKKYKLFGKDDIALPLVHAVQSCVVTNYD